MKHSQFIVLFFLLIFVGIESCNQSTKQLEQDTTKQTITQSSIDSNTYLLQVCDATGKCGYANQKGDTVIALDKYEHCFTDTFRTYAIVVLKGKSGFWAIDRKANVLYEVFTFDNGPDYPAEGLFRILVQNKIGYADEATGKIVIKPQFECAYPFENGAAQVSNNCKTEYPKEHSRWISKHWVYIDKTGNTVAEPAGVTE